MRLALTALAFAGAANFAGAEERSFGAGAFLRDADAFTPDVRTGETALPFCAFTFGAAAFDAVAFAAGFALFARRYVGLAAREAEEFDFRL